MSLGVVMAYQLLLQQPSDLKSSRAVGEHILLGDLPHDFKVYVFYYPSAAGDEVLENKLREFGQRTGNNLFVNIGGLGDEQYDEITRLFQISKLPVIVMSALDSFASGPGEPATAYVRLDNREFLRSTDAVIQFVEQIFNLFIQGKVTEAIRQAQSSERAATLSHLGRWLVDALKSIGGFIEQTDISISLFEGKFELKRTGS